MRFFFSTRFRCLLSFSLLFVPAVSLLAQSASISGIVLADSSNQPLASAIVEIPDLKLAVRSDSAGKFTLSGISPGSYTLTIRVAGYQAFAASLVLVAGQKFEADFLLKPTITEIAMATVTAPKKSRIALRLVDFESRRARHMGNYLTADLFEKNQARNFANVLTASLPGVNAVGVGSAQILVSHRLAPNCPVQVIVNGASMYNGQSGQPKFDLTELYTGDVIGVEYYNVANTPLQFNATSGKLGGSICGTLVVWTK